jgi:hypothetical protein
MAPALRTNFGHVAQALQARRDVRRAAIFETAAAPIPKGDTARPG